MTVLNEWENKRMRILAVDNNAIFLDLLTRVLFAAGYDEVTLAQSADKALSRIAASTVPFDCFLLDIRMPGKDGISLCREVRAISAYSGVPILLLTGMTDTIYIDRAFESGATDYISKPLNGLGLGPLRANRCEASDWLKFTLEGARTRTHGNALTDAAFTGGRVWDFAQDSTRPRRSCAKRPDGRADDDPEAAQFHCKIQATHSG